MNLQMANTVKVRIKRTVSPGSRPIKGVTETIVWYIWWCVVSEE